MPEAKNKVHGIIAEFDNPAELLHAAEKVRDAGYKKFDCHSPFPIHGMDAAMGLKRSPLGWMIGILGLSGALGGYLMQYWMSTVDYPLVIAGKPFNSYPAYVPVTFGIGVLLGAFTAVFGMLHLTRLPRLFHFTFFSDRFSKVTTDGFFVSIEADDAKFEKDETTKFLQSIGAAAVEVIEGS